MTTRPLRLGTRASALARWQAQWVADRLTASGLAVELVPITTSGDTTTATSLSSFGGAGAFTKELQRALLDETIDLAVHSLKDLPTEKVAGLAIAAVPLREDPADVLVSRTGATLEALDERASIGTGSLRRRAQLLHLHPRLQMRDIRGNVDTRLKKLAAGEFDAIVLAHAGLKRLGLAGHVTQIFDLLTVLPAVGQGALGIEARQDDVEVRAALAELDHPISHQAVTAERALLAALRGGCLAPLGAWARMSDGQLSLDAAVLSADGQRRLVAAGNADPSQAESLGQQVADKLLHQGAAELIAQARHG